MLIVIPRKYMFYFLSIAALSLLVLQCATVQKSTFNCGDVQILSVELRAWEAERYCRYAVGERKKVEAFWGATWKQLIRIHVDSSYRISRALGPGYFGDRGFMKMPLRRARRNNGALLHEIVHIYAPNSNRFLAEGLAVYLQDKIGGNPSFPNFGKPLPVLARERLSEVGSLNILNAVRTPTPLSSVAENRTAYILAGSFVCFLIEKYGLPKFRELYATEDYKRVYGKSLRTVEIKWRAQVSNPTKLRR